MRADHLGRPPLVSAETEKRLNFLRVAAQRLALEHAAPKPIILGRHLIALGRAPGPEFKLALENEDHKVVEEFFEKAKQRRDAWSGDSASPSPE